jgi:hypothetical protein
MEKPQGSGPHTGISNRETPSEEQEGREKFKPVKEGAAAAESVSGDQSEPSRDLHADQTSHKAGSRSVAQKEANSRYPDRSAPNSHKVAGAFGKEPDEAEARANLKDSETD